MPEADQIRRTDDGYSSVLDLITSTGGQRCAARVWFDIQRRFDTLPSLKYIKYSGQGQRLTPAILDADIDALTKRISGMAIKHKLLGTTKETLERQQQSECVIRDIYAERLRVEGELDVRTEYQIEGYGRIDILTSKRIVEVKRDMYWMHALGQVLAYSVKVPREKLEIYLYGSRKPDRKTITDTCASFNVIARFHEEAASA